MPIKQEIAEKLTGEWQIGMCTAPCTAPCWCFAGSCCPCCMAKKQRDDILDVIGEPYVCCGGLFPCCGLAEPKEDRSCLWCEVCCCTSCAIAGNRFLIQTRFDRANTACDNCILWTVCIMDWVVCILQCLCIDVPDEIKLCVDCINVSVMGCMAAQQQREIEYVKKTGFAGAKPEITQMLAPHQQHMISQAKPPAVGAQVVGQPVGK